MLHPRKARKAQKPTSSGPIKNDDGIPYDYIVVIDSGSKGSRVFVYNWLNPSYALKNKLDLNSFKNFKLVKRFEVDKPDLSDGEDSPGAGRKRDPKKPKKSKNKKMPKKPTLPVKLPKISHKKKWKTKIKPGISKFNYSPQKIGNHHLKPLLQLASKVVPKSQHYRTPIFLHSTAGMRLLNPSEQQVILDNICDYFQSNSDFFLPDCNSHVNVIQGDVEGIYGWLAVNYLVGAFDDPSSHQHGKNHTTYGLLDMGGASTQVVFQPNTTEISEHENNLFKISLYELPALEGDTYLKPKDLKLSVYSDSLLGLGITQAYQKYLSSLVEHDDTTSGFFYKPPIQDPCLPKGYISSTNVNDVKYDFTGDSNFELCLTSIFPVIKDSTYGSSSQSSGDCQQYSEGKKVSSCLLNDLTPAFDFDINYFYGVSGYWYGISKLTQYNKAAGDRLFSRKAESTDVDYDYKMIYESTKNICSKSYSELIEINNFIPEKDRLSLDDLSNLCFKASWVLNFLHLGLGFPRLGIDEMPQNDKFKSLKLVDKINGTEFSWTLGRALLYANDEYVDAYNNYTAEQTRMKGENEKEPEPISGSGFIYSPTPAYFHYGSEQNGIEKRPAYVEPDPEATYKYYDYETKDHVYNELKWYIEPHRWYGIGIFAILLGLIFWLLVGQKGRTSTTTAIKKKFNQLKEFLSSLRGGKYHKISDVEVAEFELNTLEPASSE